MRKLPLNFYQQVSTVVLIFQTHGHEIVLQNAFLSNTCSMQVVLMLQIRSEEEQVCNSSSLHFLTRLRISDKPKQCDRGATKEPCCQF